VETIDTNTAAGKGDLQRPLRPGEFERRNTLGAGWTNGTPVSLGDGNLLYSCFPCVANRDCQIEVDVAGRVAESVAGERKQGNDKEKGPKLQVLLELDRPRRGLELLPHE